MIHSNSRSTARPDAGSRSLWTRAATVASGLFVLALVLSLLPGDAVAAKGGKRAGKQLTVTLDDQADDAIRSDGKGSYDGALKPDGSLVVHTGKKRAFFFDFSDCLPDPVNGFETCYTPFGGSGVGEISGVTLTIPGFTGDAGTSSEVDAKFEFVVKGAVRSTKWLVETPIEITRTADGEGGVESSWRAVDDGPVAVWYHSGRGFGPGGYYPGAWFRLPWGADGS